MARRPDWGEDVCKWEADIYEDIRRYVYIQVGNVLQMGKDKGEFHRERKIPTRNSESLVQG